ncbi:MAG: hypothetical protein R3304_04395 [Longimicrobiales bacterium]|nr:hypothetical protein [Longimicrobiales bacterium]
MSKDEITGTPVSDLVARASDVEVLDEAEEARLVVRTASGQDAALETLVRAHLRIAVDEAIRNRGLGAPQDRLVRVGAKALVEAAPSYDPEEHGTFSRFATRVVRTAIKAQLVS